MTTNKKPLLSEGNTRRMMGLAGLDALSNTFINERFVKEETQEEDLKLNEMPDDMAGEPPMPPETDMAPAEEDPATGGDVDISSLVAAITQAITDQTGVPIEVEGGDVDGEEPPVDDMGGEAPMSSEPMMHENEEELEESSTEELTEDNSPLSATTKTPVPSPKVTKPGDQGQPKSTPRDNVEGADKPEKMPPNGTAKMKALEESQLAKRVLTKILNEIRSAKAKQTAKVVAKPVSKVAPKASSTPSKKK